MSGPAPLPTNVKALRGTLRSERTNPDEPKLDLGRPPAPAGLSKQGRVVWHRFADLAESMAVLTLPDAAALESLVTTYLEVRKLRRLVDKHGHVYEAVTAGGEVMLRANPAVAMLHAADTRLRMQLVEFGMTPAARTKVHTVQHGKPKVSTAAEDAAGRQRKSTDRFFAA